MARRDLDLLADPIGPHEDRNSSTPLVRRVRHDLALSRRVRALGAAEADLVAFAQEVDPVAGHRLRPLALSSLDPMLVVRDVATDLARPPVTRVPDWGQARHEEHGQAHDGSHGSMLAHGGAGHE